MDCHYCGAKEGALHAHTCVDRRKLAAEKGKVDVYLGTVERLEPNIHAIDPGAYYASAAVSQKRIADALERIALALENPGTVAAIENNKG